MSDLKPCPFCGNTDIEWQESHVGFSIECYKCDFHIGGDLTLEAVTKQWNTRASGWISVDERLPEKNGQYLVKIQKTPFNPCGISLDSFSKVVHPYFSSERISRQKVTHWMPLPTFY